jgi:hypothetical protein
MADQECRTADAERVMAGVREREMGRERMAAEEVAREMERRKVASAS